MALRAAGTMLGFLILVQLLVVDLPLKVACHSEYEKCVYKLKVITAPVKGSEKNTKVGITFSNSKGQEASFASIPTRHEPECHETDEFYHSPTPCLPDLCKMRLYFDKFDADIATLPRIFLTSVEVGNVLIDEGKRRFDINGWLAIDEPPFLVDRTFDLCSWTSMPRTAAATTTPVTSTIITNCITNFTVAGSSTTTTSVCSSTTTTDLPF